MTPSATAFVKYGNKIREIRLVIVSSYVGKWWFSLSFAGHTKSWNMFIVELQLISSFLYYGNVLSLLL